LLLDAAAAECGSISTEVAIGLAAYPRFPLLTGACLHRSDRNYGAGQCSPSRPVGAPTFSSL